MKCCLRLAYCVFSASFALINSLPAVPPKEVPPELYDDYSLGGKIPIYEWYFNDTYSANQPIVFSKEEINSFIEHAKKRGTMYYGATDLYLYSMLDKYAAYIKGKKIGIIGSRTPWYESIAFVYGGEPITVEYNKIRSDDDRFTVMTVAEYEQNPQKFDAIISISSIEHDGLGRYGDPLNPWGDVIAMAKMKEMLQDDGLVFLAVPVAADSIDWNAHRVYGPLRLPLLFDQWEVLDSSGFNQSDFSSPCYNGHQPVFVLKKKSTLERP